jgi:hypothetical protein
MKKKTNETNNGSGWIKLYRQMLEWEWYDDKNTWRLFIHCLLKANYKDKKWRGIIIKRGSFITSINKLSLETKLTPMQTRFSLNKLKLTNEISTKSTYQYTVISVINYDKYQSNYQADYQTSNKRVTTTKKYKEYKEVLPNKVIRKPPAYGNPLINFVLKEFEERWGYPPTDKKPRFEAYNLLRKINGYIKAFGKEPTDEYVRRAVIFLLDNISHEDWAENIQTLGVIRRKMPIYLQPPKGGERE